MTAVALVGAGRWGRTLMRALTEACEVLWCCTREDSAVRAWLTAEHPGIPHAHAYDAVLADSRVEAVVLATPIATHAGLALRALEAGKHVFVEKPLATSTAEAAALVERARAAGRTLFVGYLLLYHPVFEKLTRCLAGDPARRASLVWSRLGTFGEDIFWDLVSHEVSLAIHLFAGRPDDATLLHRSGLVSAIDVVSARLDFGAGRDCLVVIDRCATRTRKAVTVLTESGAVLVWDGDALYRLVAARSFEPVMVAAERPLPREVAAFLRCVESGTPAPSDGVHGALVVEVVESLMRRCVEGAR